MSRGNQRRRTASPLKRFFFSMPKRPVSSNRFSTLQKCEVGRASVSYLVVFTVVSVLVTAALIYHLHLRLEGVWLGYETSRARAERAQLVAEQRELRLELSSLKSPERVETEAREKLGMEMPGNDRIIPIEKKATPLSASGRAR